MNREPKPWFTANTRVTNTITNSRVFSHTTIDPTQPVVDQNVAIRQMKAKKKSANEHVSLIGKDFLRLRCFFHFQIRKVWLRSQRFAKILKAFSITYFRQPFPDLLQRLLLNKSVFSLNQHFTRPGITAVFYYIWINNILRHSKDIY